MPVVSIISDSLCLFDYDSGIYVPGLNHDQNPTAGGVWGSGNYHLSGDDWERKAHVEFFSDSGQLELSQRVGIRIHGSGSRAYPQKSLRLYARKKYGESKFEFEAFPGIEKDEFDVLVLRNFGQDFVTGVAQDALASRLIKNLNQASLAYRGAITFINGEYWGSKTSESDMTSIFWPTCMNLKKIPLTLLKVILGESIMGIIPLFGISITSWKRMIYQYQQTTSLCLIEWTLMTSLIILLLEFILDVMIGQETMSACGGKGVLLANFVGCY